MSDLQGTNWTNSDPAALLDIVERAFEYRGDITVLVRDHADPIVGYIFDRTRGDSIETSNFRLMTALGERVAVELGDITRLDFSGRDTAAGKSFETWISRYIDRKRAGKTAGIESDPLD